MAKIDPVEFASLHKLLMDDQYFGPIYRVLSGSAPANKIEKHRLSKPLDHYQIRNGELFYGGKLCVPRK